MFRWENNSLSKLNLCQSHYLTNYLIPIFPPIFLPNMDST